MFRLTVARATRAPIVANRAFSTTYAAYKLPEPVEKVNRAAGDTLLKGIETVESATESVKEAAQPITEKVSELTGDAKAEAKKKGADAYTSAQNAANTAKGEAYKAKAELDRKTGA